MNINIPVRVKGFIKAEVVKHGKVVRETPFFPNLITKTGLNKLGSETRSWVTGNSYAFAGDGNTPPTINDNSLVSQLGKARIDNSDVTQIAPSAPDYYHEAQVVVTFAVGDIVGNVSEIGFGTNSIDSELCVRALVKDGMGNPTTLPVAADEALRLTYYFRKYIPQGSFTGTTAQGDGFTIKALRAASGASWRPSYTFRASGASAGQVYATDGGLADIEASQPLGSIVGSVANSVLSPEAYVADSYSLTYSGSVLSGGCNGTFQSVVLMTSNAPFTLQCEFDTAQTKNSSEKIDISFTISWAEKAI